MKFYIRTLTAALVFAALASPLASGAASSGLRPELTIDLRQFGYEFPKQFRPQSAYRLLINKVLFIDNHVVAVSLSVRNPNPGLSVRGTTFGGPFLFQTVFLDARTGKVLRTQTWSNSVAGSGLFAGPNGGFVVWHDLDLSFHAADGSVVATLRLNPKDFPRAVGLTQSPGGNTLFAIRHDTEGGHILRIRTADLKELGWSNFSGYWSEVGSDSYFAFLRQKAGSLPPRSGWGGPPMDLFVSEYITKDLEPAPERPIFTTSTPGCDSVVFLDNQTLAVSGGCHDFTILNTSGKILYQHQFAKVLTGAAIPCRGCDMLTFATYVLKGGSAFLDTFPKVAPRGEVFLDRQTNKLLELPYTRSAKYVSAMALSPNGCLQAIQVDSSLEIYHLCGSEIGLQLGLAHTEP